MPIYIVLQKIVLFRIAWRNLYVPDTYSLILITHTPTRRKLPLEQAMCFSHIYSLDNFNFGTVKNTIEAIRRNHSAPLQIVTNDELCILLAAQLRQEFKLPGDTVETVLPFLNKQISKQKLQQTDIPLPRHIIFNPDEFAKNESAYLQSIYEYLQFPIFAKPIDSAASQYTCKIMNESELQTWCHQHSNAYHYELDEYIDGVVFHCESIVKNNVPLHVQIAKNIFPPFAFMAGKITGSIILHSDDQLLPLLMDFNQRILSALKPIPNGVTHLECFRRSNGELLFLEIACRAPGGMIVQMHEKNCHSNFEQAHFMLQMGLPFTASISLTNFYSAWAWFPTPKGEVIGFSLPAINSPHTLQWKVKVGDICQSAKSLIDYAGGILLWNSSYSELENDMNMLANHKTFVLTKAHTHATD